MLDIQTLVEADKSYRKLLIAELPALDRNWSFINNKPGGNPDQKQIRVRLQTKLALLSLVQVLPSRAGDSRGFSRPCEAFS